MKTRDEVMAEARSNIAFGRSVERDLRQRLMAAPFVESASARWRREQTQDAERRERERALDRCMTDHVRAELMEASTDWQARIDQAVAAERAYWNEALPELIALVRQQITAEISAAVAGVSLDVAAMKHAQTKRKRARASNIVDLPNPLMAKQR
jgi:hypothetical protein